MQPDNRHRFSICLALAAMTAGTVLAQTKPATPAPLTSAAATAPQTQQLPPGWEQVDQRLVFLTVQLSIVESSIEATNKALVAKGYQKQSQDASAEAARQKNQHMDAMGGGPVPWQDFYGRTAQTFFYHPTDNNTIHVNPRPEAQRPPQFDYIYRANQDSQQKAQDEAAKIGDKINDLLTYRKELESEQSALWCKIVLRGVVSKGFTDRPLYHLDLTGPAGDAGRQSVEAATAAVAFLKAIDAEVVAAQKNMDDQEGTLNQLLVVTAGGRAQMQEKLLKLPDYAKAISDPKDPLGKFFLLTKRAEDSAQNLVDARKLAADGQTKDDRAAMQRYRAQFQQSAIDYADSIMTAHEALATAVAGWKVTPVANSSTPVTSVPADPNSVTARLDAAKAAFAIDISSARRSLVGVVDQRLNDAADAGDLNKVQQLQSAKVKAASDGTVDESITDPIIVSAKKTMDQTISEARAKLAVAYRTAISDLTKARKFTDAAAVQEEFKTSGLDNLASAQNPTPPAPAVAGDKPSQAEDVSGYTVEEPTFTDESIVVRLADVAKDLVLGAGGRLQFYRISKLRKLAVFDVNQAKVVKYIDLPDDDILYAANRDLLLIATRETGEIQTWSLSNLTKLSTSRGIGPQVKAMVMGYDSTGQVFISLPNDTYIVDPRTLTRGTAIKWGGAGSLVASADGRTLCSWDFPGWAGSHCVLVRGNEVVETYSGGYMHYNELILPHDGSLIYDTMEAGKTFSTDYKSQIGWEGLPGYAFPSDDPAYFIAYSENGNRDKSNHSKLVIGTIADRRAVVTLKDLPELDGTVPVRHSQRVIYYPNANLLVTLGNGGDSLTLRKLDIYKTLADKGIDYLVVTSSPPLSAAKGRSLDYQLAIKSRRGSAKYSLDSGPTGMTVSPTGLVHWSVPSTIKESSVSIIIRVTDASQQEVFQSFSLSLK